jgi:hypothetical protein
MYSFEGNGDADGGGAIFATSPGNETTIGLPGVDFEPFGPFSFAPLRLVGMENVLQAPIADSEVLSEPFGPFEFGPLLSTRPDLSVPFLESAVLSPVDMSSDGMPHADGIPGLLPGPFMVHKDPHPLRPDGVPGEQTDGAGMVIAISLDGTIPGLVSGPFMIHKDPHPLRPDGVPVGPISGADDVLGRAVQLPEYVFQSPVIIGEDVTSRTDDPRHPYYAGSPSSDGPVFASPGFPDDSFGSGVIVGEDVTHKTDDPRHPYYAGSPSSEGHALPSELSEPLATGSPPDGWWS